eukprot:gene143-biopygen12059
MFRTPCTRGKFDCQFTGEPAYAPVSRGGAPPPGEGHRYMFQSTCSPAIYQRPQRREIRCGLITRCCWYSCVCFVDGYVFSYVFVSSFPLLVRLRLCIRSIIRRCGSLRILSTGRSYGGMESCRTCATLWYTHWILADIVYSGKGV